MQKKELIKSLTVRISPVESKMIEELRESPYFVNISSYIRASIRHLYKKHMNKSGRK